MVWLASLEADNEQAPPSLLVAELQGFLEIVGLLLGNLDQARRLQPLRLGSPPEGIEVSDDHIRAETVVTE
jgi:hypothetical protein